MSATLATLHDALRTLHSAGPHAQRPAPSSRDADADADFPALRADVWRSVAACLASFRVPSKHARRLGDELTYGLHVAAALCAGGGGASLCEWAWSAAAVLAWLAAHGTVADDAAVDVAVPLLPGALFDAGAAALSSTTAVGGSSSAAPSGPRGAGTSLLRLDDAVPLAHAALAFVIAMPPARAAAWRSASRGSCPLAALATSAARLLSAAAAAQPNSRKTLGTLLRSCPSRLPAIDPMSGGAPANSMPFAPPASPLAALLELRDVFVADAARLAAPGGTVAATIASLFPQQLCVATRELEAALRGALFAHDMVPHYGEGGLNAAVAFAQHACLALSPALTAPVDAPAPIAAPSAPSAGQKRARPVEGGEDGAVHVLLRLPAASGEGALFAALRAPFLAGSDGGLSISAGAHLRALPFLLAEFVRAHRAVKRTAAAEAMSQVHLASKRFAARSSVPAAAAPPPAAGSSSSVVRALQSAPEFGVLVELVAIATGYVPTSTVELRPGARSLLFSHALSSPAAGAPATLTALREVALRARSLAALLSVAVECGICSEHEDAAPHPQAATFSAVSQWLHASLEALVTAAPIVSTSPAGSNDVSACAVALAALAAVLLELGIDCLNDLRAGPAPPVLRGAGAVLEALVSVGSGAPNSKKEISGDTPLRCALAALVCTLLRTAGRARQLEAAAVHPLLVVLLPTHAAPLRVAALLHAVLTSGAVLCSFSAALRSMPPGQVHSLAALVIDAASVASELASTASSPVDHFVGSSLVAHTAALLTAETLRQLSVGPTSALRHCHKAVFAALGPAANLARSAAALRARAAAEDSPSAALRTSHLVLTTAALHLQLAATDVALACAPYSTVRALAADPFACALEEAAQAPPAGKARKRSRASDVAQNAAAHAAVPGDYLFSGDAFCWPVSVLVPAAVSIGFVPPSASDAVASATEASPLPRLSQLFLPHATTSSPTVFGTLPTLTDMSSWLEASVGDVEASTLPTPSSFEAQQLTWATGAAREALELFASARLQLLHTVIKQQPEESTISTLALRSCTALSLIVLRRGGSLAGRALELACAYATGKATRRWVRELLAGAEVNAPGCSALLCCTRFFELPSAPSYLPTALLALLQRAASSFADALSLSSSASDSIAGALTAVAEASLAPDSESAFSALFASEAAEGGSMVVSSGTAAASATCEAINSATRAVMLALHLPAASFDPCSGQSSAPSFSTLLGVGLVMDVLACAAARASSSHPPALRLKSLTRQWCARVISLSSSTSSCAIVSVGLASSAAAARLLRSSTNAEEERDTHALVASLLGCALSGAIRSALAGGSMAAHNKRRSITSVSNDAESGGADVAGVVAGAVSSVFAVAGVSKGQGGGSVAASAALAALNVAARDLKALAAPARSKVAAFKGLRTAAHALLTAPAPLPRAADNSVLLQHAMHLCSVLLSTAELACSCDDASAFPAALLDALIACAERLTLVLFALPPEPLILAAATALLGAVEAALSSYSASAPPAYIAAATALVSLPLLRLAAAVGSFTPRSSSGGAGGAPWAGIAAHTPVVLLSELATCAMTEAQTNGALLGGFFLLASALVDGLAHAFDAHFFGSSGVATGDTPMLNAPAGTVGTVSSTLTRAAAATFAHALLSLACSAASSQTPEAFSQNPDAAERVLQSSLMFLRSLVRASRLVPLASADLALLLTALHPLQAHAAHARVSAALGGGRNGAVGTGDVGKGGAPPLLFSLATDAQDVDVGAAFGAGLILGNESRTQSSLPTPILACYGARPLHLELEAVVVRSSALSRVYAASKHGTTLPLGCWAAATWLLAAILRHRREAALALAPSGLVGALSGAFALAVGFPTLSPANAAPLTRAFEALARAVKPARWHATSLLSACFAALAAHASLAPAVRAAVTPALFEAFAVMGPRELQQLWGALGHGGAARALAKEAHAAFSVVRYEGQA